MLSLFTLTVIYLLIGEKTLSLQYEGYTYTLHLFKSVEQSGSPQGPVNLGSGPGQWTQPGVELIMTGGASCPNGVQRSTTVRFECSYHPEKFISMEEFEMCRYQARVSTPAACIIRR